MKLANEYKILFFYREIFIVLWITPPENPFSLIKYASNNDAMKIFKVYEMCY